MEYNLLRKSELKVRDIRLDRVNLNDVAAAVAQVLQFDPSEVLVTDVLDDVLTLDILRESVFGHQIVDKQAPLLRRLSEIPGVTITDKTVISSEGMLGWIAADAQEASAAMAKADAVYADVRARLASRVMILSTGAEVAAVQIEDTNAPMLSAALTGAGFTARIGGAIQDDLELIAGRIRRAIEDGYSIIVTTGGVGAETKDCTVEATLSLDPDAAAPYVVTFEQGKGRHAKPGVRIGVGRHRDALIINLPGPNDEVRASLPILLEGLAAGAGKQALAEALAANLRTILREKMKRWRH
ncbi:MAG: molybdopterin-binding protein [Caulobacterales bacterium]